MLYFEQKISIQRIRHTWRVATLIIVSLFASSTSRSDEYHYNNLLIGDRAAGLGGAYTAIADDPAGLFYNPAGIVHSVGSNISGSMSALHKVKTTYKNALGGRFDWERKSSVLFPNFFGVFQPFGKGKIGLSYAVVDSIQEDQDQTFENVSSTVSSFTINFNNTDTTHNFGPSYAFEINQDLAFGASLYVHSRIQERITNQLSYLNSGTDVEWSNQYYYTEETGVRPVIGFLWSPMDKLSLAFTLSKTIILSATTKIQATCKGAASFIYATGDLCKNNAVTREITESGHERDHPIKITVGSAYFLNEHVLYSGDLSYFSSTDDGLQSVLNFALGLEYYLDANWALRSGLYSNNANTPDLGSSGISGIQPEHVDLLGLSFSISHFSRNSILSTGVNYSFGSGKAQLFGADSNGNAQLQDLDTDTLTLFLSATYSY